MQARPTARGNEKRGGGVAGNLSASSGSPAYKQNLLLPGASARGGATSVPRKYAPALQREREREREIERERERERREREAP
jgi:hypothetical protein